jgi:hypothetical protein
MQFANYTIFHRIDNDSGPDNRNHGFTETLRHCAQLAKSQLGYNRFYGICNMFQPIDRVMDGLREIICDQTEDLK